MLNLASPFNCIQDHVLVGSKDHIDIERMNNWIVILIEFSKVNSSLACIDLVHLISMESINLFPGMNIIVRNIIVVEGPHLYIISIVERNRIAFIHYVLNILELIAVISYFSQINTRTIIRVCCRIVVLCRRVS